MEKLTIDRSKWCSINTHKIVKGESYGCAVGHYLLALGLTKDEMKGTLEEYLQLIPKEGSWLLTKGHEISEQGYDIMFASDSQKEDIVIEKFKEYANIDVTFTGNYPK